MMVRIYLIIVLIIFGSAAGAQDSVYTLERCIDIALKNNLDINTAANQAGRDEISRKQARLNMLPNLNASVSHGWFFGRGIDQTTNTYVDNNFYSGGYNVGGDVAIFNGLQLQNIAKQNKMIAESSKMSWQQQKDNITLNIMLAYLQLMNAQDMLVQSTDQAALSAEQVERLRTMDAQGAIPPSDLYDVQAQYANDQATIINAKRDVQTAKINICSILNIPFDSTMQFERINSSGILQKSPVNSKEAYANALANFAQVKAAEFSFKSAQYSLKAARARLYPSLSFGYGLGSNYTQGGGNIMDQLKNNNSKNIGFTLSIPVFNNLQLRNNVKLAKINLKEAQQTSAAVKTELQQNIETAIVNMDAAYERYIKLVEQVEALQKSFGAAEARFNAGKWNSVEYLTVKNNLDRANINLIAGKYEYLLRVRIYNYYQGNTIASE